VGAIDGPTGRWIDGRAELIGRDLPAHIARTFLGHQSERDTPFAIQAISLGAAWTVRVMFSDPARFASVALMGTFCDAEGFLPERDLGDPSAREGFYRALAARTRAARFAIRMNIGRRDRLYDCNKRWYLERQRAGVFAAQTEPTYERCRTPNAHNSRECVLRWPGFTVLPGLGHHYAAVVPLFEEDLRWQLDRLAALTE
jgi:alpha-beta hydrolase superfamily lysophospholipase